MKITYLKILVLLLILSCQDQSNVMKEDIVDPTRYSEDLPANAVDPLLISELSNELFSWGENLLHVSKDPEARQLIYAEIDKKFDDDYNVLFSTLVEAGTQQNIASIIQMNNRIISDQTKGSTITPNGFAILDNKEKTKHYPQIYIPEYSSIKRNISDPILVFNIGAEEMEELDGYILNDIGRLEKLNYKITQAIASENEVWVISINESVSGETDSSLQRQLVKGGREEVNENAIMTRMAFYDLKESYFSGKPEIRMRRVSSFFEQSSDWVGTSSNKGSLIRKSNRSELGRWINVNWTYYPSWNPTGGNTTGAVGDVMTYVIFEYDSWPVRYRTFGISGSNPQCPYEVFSPCRPGNYLQFRYRSKNSIYDGGNIFYDSNYPQLNARTFIKDRSYYPDFAWESTL